MLIILGFAVATLLALIVGRLAWSLALRLGARKNQRSMPSTVAELKSDRDRLRAEHAMMAKKMQMRIDDMRMRSAEQMSEVSRTRNRMVVLMQEMAKRDALLAEREASLTERNASLAERDAELAKLQEQMKTFAKEMTAPAEALSAAGNAGENALQPIIVENASTQDRLQQRINELTNLSDQISKQREKSEPVETAPPASTIFFKPADSTNLQAPIREPEAKITEAEQTATELQDELKRLDQAWSASAPDAAPVAEAEEKPKRGITNVISLAQRIKALQKTIPS